MAANNYYDSSGWPPVGAKSSTASFRAEFDAIEDGFDKLPDPTIAGLICVTDGTKIDGMTAEELKSVLSLENVQNTDQTNADYITSGTLDEPRVDPLIARVSQLAAHESNNANPHGVTKSQVGLGNADNTADINKPVSTAQQAAIDAATDPLEVDIAALESTVGGHTSSLSSLSSSVSTLSTNKADKSAFSYQVVSTYARSAINSDTLLQSGTFLTTAGSSTYALTYPIAFSTYGFIVITNGDTTSNVGTCGVDSFSKTGATIRNLTNTDAMRINWFAFGDI